MNTPNYDSVPDVICWQGQDIFLAEIQAMPTIKGSPTRYVFVDKAGFPKLMQYEWEGYPIDWQALEAANKEAPQADVKEDRREHKWRLFSKAYSKATRKKKVVRNQYAEFIDEMESWGDANNV